MTTNDGGGYIESVSGYWLGRTPTVASQRDQRFSYCLYVPPKYRERAQDVSLLVVMHDTLRNHHGLREAFIDYAERVNAVVLAPLFPCGIDKRDELDNYKYIQYHGIRFDELLLSMVDEVAQKYGIDVARFGLFGFSGGAHFAHRFLLLHPHRLSALVVGAPGSVTLPTEDYPWWPGVGDFAAIFGRPVEWEQVRPVPTLLVVGADDLNARGIVTSADHPNWTEGANIAGSNRVERLRTLHAHLSKRQSDVRLEILPGVRHDLSPLVRAAIPFFEAHAAGRRSERGNQPVKAAGSSSD